MIEKGCIVYITGRPSAGKSTFALELSKRLASTVPRCILDSDSVRAALVPKPGYDPRARENFYETLANLAVLIASQEKLVLVPATATERRFRAFARDRGPAFYEVFVDTPIEECKARDAKGLYKKLEQGQVHDLPGVDVAYEPPEAPDIVAHGGLDTQALENACALIAARWPAARFRS